MRAPDSIIRWDRADELLAGMGDAGFRIPDRFIELSATFAGKNVQDWRGVWAAHANSFVQSGGDTDRFDPRAGEVQRVRVGQAMDPKFLDACSLHLADWMNAEVRGDEMLQADWSEKRSHLRRVAQRLAKQDGFIVTKKGYALSLAGGYSLEIEVEVGRPGSCVQQFATYNRLRDEHGRWSMWLPWSELVPGIDCYMNGQDSREMCWGIKAFSTIAKLFAQSLGH